ncbi:MAG: DUF4192 domain-containing protein [Candidatus Nanopelagicales bacterium]
MTQKTENAKKGPSSLVAAIPHLVGFEPESSLVLVAIAKSSYRVQLVIRLDLIGQTDSDLLEKVNQSITSAQKEAGADIFLPVFYIGGDWQKYRGFLKDFYQTEPEAIELLDAVWVNQNRYGSILCENQECCPAEGYQLPDQTSLEKLQLISQGKAVMPSRGNIESYFQSKAANKKLTLALSKILKASKRSKSPSFQENLYNRVLVNLMQSDHELNLQEQAEVLFATGEVGLRDRLISEVLSEIQSQTEPLDKLHKLKARLLPAIQSAPEGQAKTILTCLGLWLWQLGESVWAEAAIKQALEHDESYRLGILALSAMKSGLPPWRFADCFIPTTSQ